MRFRDFNTGLAVGIAFSVAVWTLLLWGLLTLL